ncbi:unnamed protein product, partial [Rotaria sordida]
NLVDGTIFGFPALFKILRQHGIYGNQNNCSPSFINQIQIENRELSCEGHQTRQYQIFENFKLFSFILSIY